MFKITSRYLKLKIWFIVYLSINWFCMYNSSFNDMEIAFCIGPAELVGSSGYVQSVVFDVNLS